jgi:cobalt-zinc-cadmium efflux system membrane fusion protein
LLEEQGNFYVYVQLNPELFEKKEIKLGDSDGIRTEVTQGLKENDRIVSKGAVFIKLSQSTGTLDAHSGHVH